MIHDSFLKKFRETKSPFITNPYRFAPTGVGGWVELGRTTLGSAGDTIDVTSLPDKRYYMVLHEAFSSSAINSNLRLGNSTIDTGNNYAERQSSDGSADSTVTSTSQTQQWGTLTGNRGFGFDYIVNLSTKEKLVYGQAVKQNTAGASNAPSRWEGVAKWANTSNVIDILNRRTSVNTYNTGSEVVVLGWDESDTHTNNFWEELASVNGTGSSTNLSSGTITAKKYLWIQCFIDSSATMYSTISLNNVTGSNYSSRKSDNGAGDGTGINQAGIFPTPNIVNGHFTNMFIINNSSNEKLCIINDIAQNTSGAGTAPQRREQVAKWVNTSSQITEIDFDSSSGNYGSNSILKVWGAN